MRYFLLFIMVFLFIGCGEPAEKDEDTSTSSSSSSSTTVTNTDKHIVYGGSGTSASPYLAGSGSFGSDDSDDTYYSVTLNGSCNVLLYEQNYISSFYLFSSGFGDYTVDATHAIGDKSGFKLYNSVPSGTYTLKSNVSNVDSGRLGIFGVCINNVYSSSLPSVVDGTNNFTDFSKLYSFSLGANTLVKINRMENIHYFYIFDSAMNLIYTSKTANYSNTLSTGTYYLLIGSSSSSQAEFNFIR